MSAPLRRGPALPTPGLDKIAAAKQDRPQRNGSGGLDRYPDSLRARWTPAYVEGRERVLGGRDGLERAARRIADLIESGRLPLEQLLAVVEVVAWTRPEAARRDAERIVLRYVARRLSDLGWSR